MQFQRANRSDQAGNQRIQQLIASDELLNAHSDRLIPRNQPFIVSFESVKLTIHSRKAFSGRSAVARQPCRLLLRTTRREGRLALARLGHAEMCVAVLALHQLPTHFIRH
jgi:hypothetical protein